MTMSRAASSTMPLCARRSVYSAAKRSRRSSSVGSRTFAPHRSTPSRDAAPRTASSGPSSVSSTTRRRSSVSAARRTRSSVPSGSTMCFFASRARSSSVYSNISGVTASERATSKRSSRSSPSTCVLEHRQRLGDLARRVAGDHALARAGQDRRLERPVPREHDRQHRREALQRPQDRLRRPQPAGQHDPRGRGQHRRRVREQRRQHHLRAVAGRDQHRAVLDAVHQVRQRHRRHRQVQRLAPEQLRRRRRSPRPRRPPPPGRRSAPSAGRSPAARRPARSPPDATCSTRSARTRLATTPTTSQPDGRPRRGDRVAAPPRRCGRAR